MPGRPSSRLRHDGLFGLVDTGAPSVHAARLLARVEAGSSIGWGLVGRDAAGALHRCVSLSRFRFAMTLPSLAPPLIGHARAGAAAYAGTEEALQPLVFTDDSGTPFAVAHLGRLDNAVAWCRTERLTWLSANDSEIVGRALARDPAPWPDRLRTLAAKLLAPYALVVGTQAGLWVMRRGYPLFATRTRACSRRIRAGQLIGEDVPVWLDGRPTC
jgi:hypothetical protein